MAEIQTYLDAASLTWAAAEHFVTLAAEAIAARGQFVVALSGGSPPMPPTRCWQAKSLQRAWTGRISTFPGATSAAPRFDLILLGMGADGHTASLFPDTVALHEQTRWVVAHYVDKLSAWRVTLSPVVINAAAHVTFVVSGAGKAEGLREVLAGAYQSDALPAQIVRPANGHSLWLTDAGAAVHLEEGKISAGHCVNRIGRKQSAK